MKGLLSLTLLLFASSRVFAHGDHTPLGQWIFAPNYMLPEGARNYPGPKVDAPVTEWPRIASESAPLRFFGRPATQRVCGLLPPDRLPREQFSVELWILDHINRPIVGGLITTKGRDIDDTPAWVLGYSDKQVYFTASTRDSGRPLVLTQPIPPNTYYKRYWLHLVATYDGKIARIFVNGQERASAALAGSLVLPAKPELEIAAYLDAEPYMILSNLIKGARIHAHPLPPEEIVARFESLKQLVDDGRIFTDLFHFNAGPYLQMATQTSINVVWETDRPARGMIEYGIDANLGRKKELAGLERIQEVTLDGLAPHTPHFYRVSATDESGATIDSGLLTFQTGVADDSAYSFAVIGDTETRPHINDRLAKQIWEERPNFMMDVGDLTDAGKRHHKFEWNYEYFTGMTQLVSRIPMFPVPGNGEWESVKTGEEPEFWYRRYHRLPLPEWHYSFRYGNSEFFVLDSNREMGPQTEQGKWLDDALSQSKARWKFVAHHHPTYTSDENDHGDTWRGSSTYGNLKVRSMVPLYEKHRVDIVFFGHLHSYERTWPIKDGRVNRQQGVMYVQSGGGGGNIENHAPNKTWFSNKNYRGNHYCIINVHEGHLEFKMYDTEGRLRDFFQLDK